MWIVRKFVVCIAVLQSNKNIEPIGCDTGNHALETRILGIFSSRTPATTSEPKEIADGASSGGGKHVDVGQPKALEYSSILKRDKRW